MTTKQDISRLALLQRQWQEDAAQMTEASSQTLADEIQTLRDRMPHVLAYGDLNPNRPWWDDR